MLKKYILYLLRWQLSTPILALALWVMRACPYIVATIVANLIGGLLFFWVDRLIFKTPHHGRLIDADKLEAEICCGCRNYHHRYENCIDCAIANAPTVIPADKPK